jgi:hypothetical protein
MSFTEVVVEVHEALEAAGVGHAFGGALALAYYAEPRATVDIDVNVFSPDDGGGRAVAALRSIGYAPEAEEGTAAPIAGIRFRRATDPFPVDLFLPLDPVYGEIADRVRTWPFGPTRNELPFLSAEDLAVFKLSFGRDKDWVDLRQVCRSGLTLDLDYVERQLLILRGPTMHPRLARLRGLAG